jgi:hypothetical protein
MSYEGSPNDRFPPLSVQTRSAARAHKATSREQEAARVAADLDARVHFMRSGESGRSASNCALPPMSDRPVCLLQCPIIGSQPFDVEPAELILSRFDLKRFLSMHHARALALTEVLAPPTCTPFDKQLVAPSAVRTETVVLSLYAGIVWLVHTDQAKKFQHSGTPNVNGSYRLLFALIPRIRLNTFSVRPARLIYSARVPGRVSLRVSYWRC